VPKTPSENTEAINMKIPPAWIKMADDLRKSGAMPVAFTRTAMLRAALGYGLEALSRENDRHRARQERRARRAKRRSS
jgi:hypothetical protein